MREIKFRGKRIDTGKWVHGYYFKTPLSVESAKGAQISDGLHFLSGETRHCIAAEDGSVYEVDPETIGQYAGQKDKTGKDMYEGDIVKPRDSDFIHVVVFTLFGFTMERVSYREDRAWWVDVKITGNKYDNPEQIEKALA